MVLRRIEAHIVVNMYYNEIFLEDKNYILKRVEKFKKEDQSSNNETKMPS